MRTDGRLADLFLETVNWIARLLPQNILRPSLYQPTDRGGAVVDWIAGRLILKFDRNSCTSFEYISKFR